MANNQENGLKKYLEEIGKFPRLSKEEQEYLMSEPQRQKESSRQKVITSTLRLVVSIAKKYSSYDLSLTDLIEEGNLGLIKAHEKFDSKRNCKFSTYATYRIKQSITKALAEKHMTQRLPFYLSKEIPKIGRLLAKQTQELLRKPTHEESVEYIAINLEIDEIIARKRLTRYLVLSKNSNGGIALDSSNGANKNKTINPDIDSRLGDHLLTLETILSNERRKIAHQLINETIPQEKIRNIIRYRYGFIDGNPHTLEDTGIAFNLTKERIRQLEVRALQNMREHKNNKDFKDYSGTSAKKL
ncbi:MAG: RNA polymerase sigma factor RpoD/SigA [Nanoarchaeota archaeon]|nr:RNA polymerase sigma factor RpoD/SigA [Nanoarchaeota archaeon]